MSWLRSAFPDLRFHIDDLIGEHDRVALRWTATGTHRGPLDDLGPTGRVVTWTGTDWLRFSGGKIVEVWAFADGDALDSQLRGQD